MQSRASLSPTELLSSYADVWQWARAAGGGGRPGCSGLLKQGSGGWRASCWATAVARSVTRVAHAHTSERSANHSHSVTLRLDDAPYLTTGTWHTQPIARHTRHRPSISGSRSIRLTGRPREPVLAMQACPWLLLDARFHHACERLATAIALLAHTQTAHSSSSSSSAERSSMAN